MCRCNNCMRIFDDDTQLELLFEDSNGIHLLSEGYGMANAEIFRGCPDCKTDAYLMDLKINKKCISLIV